MKFIKNTAVLLSAALLSLSLSAYEVKGESFEVTGELMNLNLTDEGGVITISSNAGRYGKVFLTYNVTVSPSDPSRGYFSGKGIGFNDEGERNVGNRQGVFTREGTVIKFYSLDNVSDGNINYCESVLDLRTGSFNMTFYPL